MDCSRSDFSIHGILQATILQWIAIPLSRGSSQPRDQTRVSWIAGEFFTVWATREALMILGIVLNGSLKALNMKYICILSINTISIPLFLNFVSTS